MPSDDPLRRLTITLPESVLNEVRDKLAQSSPHRGRINFSSLVEACLKEALEADDLAALITRHGGSARRKRG